ncbi:hypothetical protein DFH28DRAFT_453417 [Melampsora americana]|nr:hypothetical protein DFH28DRAFT_453417 [Melampsora americana]
MLDVGLPHPSQLLPFHPYQLLVTRRFPLQDFPHLFRTHQALHTSRPSSARPSLPYFPPTPNWSAPVTPYLSDIPPETSYCQPHVHSPWPEPYQPPHSNSYSSYPDPGSVQPQPIPSSSMNASLFSPPATPWCRRTDTMPNLAHQTPVSSYFASSGPDPTSQPFDPSRTRRHQSLPPTPALSLQSGRLWYPEFRHITRAIHPIMEQVWRIEVHETRHWGPVGGSPMPMTSPQLQTSVTVRKRALPTPPLGAPITTSQDQQHSSWSNILQPSTIVGQSQQSGDTCWTLQRSMFSDHRQSTPMGSRAQPDTDWGRSPYAHEIALDQVSEGLMNRRTIRDSRIRRRRSRASHIFSTSTTRDHRRGG